jgi:uncharacterized protein YycO
VSEAVPAVTLAELADYTSRDGRVIRAGCYGVSHGSGPAGELIRHATASWAGHAFLYVGNGRIIEGCPDVARIAAADAYPDAIWNHREQITDEQRLAIVARAYALVGTPYDWTAFVGFALKVMKLRSEQHLDTVFDHDRHRVCSALVDDAYGFAGIDLEPDASISNLVSPGDLLERIIRQA